MGAQNTNPGLRGGGPEAFPTETPAQPSAPSTPSPSADSAQVIGARGYAPIFQGGSASDSGAVPTIQPTTFVPPPQLGRDGTETGLLSEVQSWHGDGADALIDVLIPLRSGFGDDWLF
jgi:hypothetical protein